MSDWPLGWRGFADAKPSESIQKHGLPGLAVAVVFPWKPDVEVLEIPVKQYKNYRPRNKAARARQLAEWMRRERDDGLVLAGFVQHDTRESAANTGLVFLEELPDTHVERHYDKWRLHFGGEHLDFAQAVALVYYFLTINIGMLRVGTMLDVSRRRLTGQKRMVGRQQRSSG